MRLAPIEHDVVDSTSERAFAALAEGTARHGDVHCARAQTAGRGRRGASWASARDEGVYASVVLLPSAPVHPAALTMAGGLAAFDAVRALGVAGARLKWPNDLVVDSNEAGELGAKLAGVLVETRGLDPARPHYVLGVGVNVRQREFPAELVRERPVTSLVLCGVDGDVREARAALLRELSMRLGQALANDSELCGDFVRATALAERDVELECGAETLRGRFQSLSLDGVVLVLRDGSRRACALEHVRTLRRRTR